MWLRLSGSMLKTKKDLPSAGTEVQLQSFLFAVAMASGSCARAQSKNMTRIPLNLFPSPLHRDQPRRNLIRTTKVCFPAPCAGTREVDQNHQSSSPNPLHRNCREINQSTKAKEQLCPIGNAQTLSHQNISC